MASICITTAKKKVVNPRPLKMNEMIDEMRMKFKETYGEDLYNRGSVRRSASRLRNVWLRKQKRLNKGAVTSVK